MTRLPSARRRHPVRRLRFGKVFIEEVMRRIWPFYAGVFVIPMFVTYVPSISLWLPRHVLR